MVCTRRKRPDHGHAARPPRPRPDSHAGPYPDPHPEAGTGQGVGRACPGARQHRVRTGALHRPPGTTCSITLTEQVTETLRGSKLIAVQAGARHHRVKTHRRTITVATGRARIAAGKTVTIKITLNRAGRTLLAKRHHLATRLTVKLGRTTVARRTLHFTAPSQETPTVSPPGTVRGSGAQAPGGSQREARFRTQPGLSATPARAGLHAARLDLSGGEADRGRPVTGRLALRAQPVRPGDGRGGQPQTRSPSAPAVRSGSCATTRTSRRCSSRRGTL